MAAEGKFGLQAKRKKGIECVGGQLLSVFACSGMICVCVFSHEEPVNHSSSGIDDDSKTLRRQNLEASDLCGRPVDDGCC